MILRFKKLSQFAVLPSAATPGDALDVFPALAPQDQILLEPGEMKLIPTGLATEFDVGWRMLLFPRSGLALKKQLTFQNAVGVIDPGYRGEIGVMLRNESEGRVTIYAGQAIGQIVMVAAPTVTIEEVATLSDSVRGTGGFGHTDDIDRQLAGEAFSRDHPELMHRLLYGESM